MHYKKKDQHRAVRKVTLACALAATAAGAQAQSNVKVYGLVDLGVVHRSNGFTGIERGKNNRLGFQGSEDLGNGLSATFHLQTRFKTDTGEQERPTIFWQGESTVGLASKTWGALRMGRAVTPMNQTNWKFEPWESSGFNASLNAFQLGNFTFSADGTNDAALGSANFIRIPNAVFYNSPTLHGFSLAVAGQVEKDANARGRNNGFALNYDSGPVALMLAGEENTDRDRIGFVGASYTLGAARLMGSFSRIDHREREDESSYVLGATYALGSGMLRAGFGRDIDLDVSRVSVGYLHSLSKRTKVYLDGWRHRTQVSASTYNGVALGVSHSF
ncbi:MAG TPA: porin [Rhodocyclaceae bacterium]|nr:porin [Rhodocyclaceae bacterium]